MTSQSRASLRELIAEDMAFRCRYEQKPLKRSTLLKLLFHPGSATVVLYRLQSHCDAKGLSWLGAVARWLNLVLFSSSFSSRARIAGGFLVIHAVANVVDDDVVIGSRCILFSQNAVTRSPFTDGVVAGPIVVPVLESDVVLGVGAAVQGGVRIGAGCRIGMNSVVETDAAPGSVLLGTPARVTATTTAGATA